MKTIIHSETISFFNTKAFFQIPLPRDAQSIKGILITLVGTDNFIVETPDAGSLWLQVAGEQNTFFAQDIGLINDNQNIELIPAVQNFFFPNNELFIHAKKTEFFSLEVPLKAKMIEGFYENYMFLLLGNSYQLQIYLKLSTHE